MRISGYSGYLTGLLLAALPAVASAHFIWLVPTDPTSGETRVCFGEDATDDGTEFLPRLKGMQAMEIRADGTHHPLKLQWSDSGLTLPSVQDQAIVAAAHSLGVMERGDSVFRLQYYAKTGPDVSAAIWKKADTAAHLQLDLVPVLRKGRVRVKVLFDGKPVKDAQVTAVGPEMEFEGTTNDRGMVALPAGGSGMYSLRARHVQQAGGEVDGRDYDETRHYVTVALPIPPADSPVGDALADIPRPVTSFGAAVLGDAVYTYGGHTGGAHSYSKAEQSNTLSKLDLATGQWSTCLEGPHLQGLALVASGERLFRVGGFTAENAAGEDHRLRSQASVAAYDPGSKLWTKMPALPEPRSSHDAAVAEGVIYVIGGWQMDPDKDTSWHATAWKLDTTADQPGWQAIAAPPFQRRALAVAALDGKIYAVGGMDKESGPTTAVSVYDPSADTWAAGPALQVVPAEDPDDRMSSGQMAGFGVSAFAVGDALYATTVQGVLQRLNEDGKDWTIVRRGLSPRFFHRMLSLNQNQYIVVGGSNMSTGKFEKVEVVDVRGE